MLRREPFFKRTPDPVASGWVLGQPRGCCSVALHAVRQTGTLAVFMWPRLLSHITPLRTLWNLNCTCISFPSNNDQHYFSEQTVKGALGGGVGRSSLHQGLPRPSRSSWWCPLVPSRDCPRPGLVCAEEHSSRDELKPQRQQSRDARWSPEPWLCRRAPRSGNERGSSAGLGGRPSPASQALVLTLQTQPLL